MAENEMHSDYCMNCTVGHSISILGLDMDNVVHMYIILCEMMALFCRERTYDLYTNNGKMKNIYKYSCRGSTASETVPMQ